jgi:hypothetical protein
MPYDPLTALVATDVTIGGVTYIVTDFSDPGAAAVGPDFQNSDGSYRGCRKVAGVRDASMTIEVEAAAEAQPAQFASFSYKGNDYVILQCGKSLSSTGAATYSLSLRWTQVTP